MKSRIPSYLARLAAAGITADGHSSHGPSNLTEHRAHERRAEYRSKWIACTFREERRQSIARKQAGLSS